VRLPEPGGPRIELGVVDTLAAAFSEHRVAHLRYRDQQGRATPRDVEPQRLVLAERRWYLAAWDRSREDWRTFRVDRIAPPVELGSGFVPRPAPDGDVAGHVMRSTSWTRHRCQARVLFDAPGRAARQDPSRLRRAHSRRQAAVPPRDRRLDARRHRRLARRDRFPLRGRVPAPARRPRRRAGEAPGGRPASRALAELNDFLGLARLERSRPFGRILEVTGRAAPLHRDELHAGSSSHRFAVGLCLHGRDPHDGRAFVGSGRRARRP